MKRSAVETILGALVILVAGFFLVFSYRTANVSAGSGGYSVIAKFSKTGGLSVGDDVRVSGVKVGNVGDIKLNPESYLAEVHMMIEKDVKLPTDTAAVISSESLLGGRFMALEPGAEMDYIEPGGTIQFTQAPQNLEQLLGQFIFSMNNDDSGDQNSDSNNDGSGN